MVTKADYDLAFEIERKHSYPVVDRYEKRFGFSIGREWLEKAARSLNCPIKVNPPNWQHGRIVYTTLMHRLCNLRVGPSEGIAFLDIGTAKGFSACVIAKALAVHRFTQVVYTADVIQPGDRVRRNTVDELDGYRTLWELINPFVPEGAMIACVGDAAQTLSYLRDRRARIPFAFVDGKHSYRNVLEEGIAIAAAQKPGDVVLFDDCQLLEVARAVRELPMYEKETVDIGPRVYVVARKK